MNTDMELVGMSALQKSNVGAWLLGLGFVVVMLATVVLPAFKDKKKNKASAKTKARAKSAYERAISSQARETWVEDGNDPDAWDEYHGKPVKTRKASKPKAKTRAKAPVKKAKAKAKSTATTKKRKRRIPDSERFDAYGNYLHPLSEAERKSAGKKAKGKTAGKSKWKAPYDERDDESMKAFWAQTPEQMFDSWQGGYAK